MKNLIYILSLIVLVLFLLNINQCKNPTIDVIHTSDTVYQIDTIEQLDTLYKPITRIINTVVYDTIIDTVFIIKDYYTMKVVEDTIVDTAGVFVRVTDTLYKNDIYSRSVYYNIIDTSSVTTNTTTIIKNDNHLSVGIGYNYNPYPVVAYKYNNFTYMLGYDMFEKNINFGILFKIR